MSSGLIGVALFGLVFAGIVLLLQGATGRDRDFLGAGLAIPPLTGRPPRDQDEVDRMHPPERHPGRLMAIGAGLILLGVVGAIAWGLLAE